MSKEKQLTIAIAGFGWWGQHIAKRLKQNSRFAVAAIIEPDDARGQEITDVGFKRLGSIDQALEDKSIEALSLIHI